MKQLEDYKAMTDQDRAEALAKDIVRQWFSRSLGAMDGMRKCKPIWERQLGEQFLAFAEQIRAQERQRCAERLCAGCRQHLPIKNGWHMDKNGKDTLVVNNCCNAQEIRGQSE